MSFMCIFIYILRPKQFFPNTVLGYYFLDMWYILCKFISNYFFVGSDNVLFSMLFIFRLPTLVQFNPNTCFIRQYTWFLLQITFLPSATVGCRARGAHMRGGEVLLVAYNHLQICAQNGSDMI